MKLTKELSIENFEAWSGAVATKEMIINNNMVAEFDCMIEELYPDGLSETELNDILWFEDEWICETLGIDIEE